MLLRKPANVVTKVLNVTAVFCCPEKINRPRSLLVHIWPLYYVKKESLPAAAPPGRLREGGPVHAEVLLSRIQRPGPVHVRPQRLRPAEYGAAGSVPGDLGGAAVLWPDFRGAGDSGDAVRPDRGCGAISDLFPEPIQAPGGERQIPELVPSHPGPALRRAAAAAG